MPSGPAGGPRDGSEGGLARNLCQVVGLNQNYISKAGTLYHIQIEDRGPVLDPVLDKEVRRVNVIVYANYGEPNARIIHGQDHDFEDRRSQEHNRFVASQITRLAAEARDLVEQKEARRVERIKGIIRQYHQSKSEPAKKALEEANTLFPFVFSRAWMELKQEKGRPVPGSEARSAPAAAPPSAVTAEASSGSAPADVVYPLDPALRERVIEIERIVNELGRDLERLRESGSADDILVQTCRKLIGRAQESIGVQVGSDFGSKRLEMTRTSLLTTWRQVQSRLR